MAGIGDYIVPFILCSVITYSFVCGVNVFAVFTRGARRGIGTALKILPSLIALSTAVGMFKVSGALDIISYGLSPLSGVLNIPSELIPLALLRPVSGSSAMIIFQDILANFHPDSYIGRVASVMMGSTETTFYTMAIYYGATRIQNTRHSLASSLTADLVGFIMSALMVRI